MRGIDYSNEHYVRVYTRNTIDWVTMSWQAQALYLMILRRVDYAGELVMSDRAEVAQHVTMPADIALVALGELVDRGWLVERDGRLIVPEFRDSQEQPASGKLRQAKHKRKKPGAHPDYTRFVEEFDLLFTKHNGCRPSWGPRQGRLVRALLDAHGYTETLRRARIMFDAPPRWMESRDLSTLHLHFDKLVGGNGVHSVRDLLDAADEEDARIFAAKGWNR